jgi:hypothetical protein
MVELNRHERKLAKGGGSVTELNFEAIRKELDKAEWEPCEDEDGRVRRVFLGTRMALCPSGKYYTPFACSNVTDEEAEADEEWYERVKAGLESLGASLESGDGDPCDLFAVEYGETPKCLRTFCREPWWYHPEKGWLVLCREHVEEVFRGEAKAPPLRRGLDYVSVPRKTLLVTELPDRGSLLDDAVLDLPDEEKD